MAFYGKKWKKIDFENILELMDKLDASEYGYVKQCKLMVPQKTRAILRQTDSVSTFLNNGDGTIQYVVTLGDKEVLNQQIMPGVEKDYTTPDGILTKNTFTLEGETLKSLMKFPDGKVLHMNREFGADKMVLRIWMEGVEPKASVTYLAV